MSKKRVFISFDYDHDETQKDFLVGQAKNKNSPFELADWSVKEHIDGNWKDKVKTRMRSVDVVCVLCGKHMSTATGVNAELKIAQELGKSYFLLAAYDGGCSKPSAAKATDILYEWSWPNLKRFMGIDK